VIVLYVALGSAVGGVCRFLLGAAIQQRVDTSFPIGTLVINITGSLLLGFLLRFSLGNPGVSAEVRAMMTAGFCGGYTTFSTFSVETATLIEQDAPGRAILYVVASAGLSLIGAFIGFALARSALGALRGE
jgi:fluoride exporter